MKKLVLLSLLATLFCPTLSQAHYGCGGPAIGFGFGFLGGVIVGHEVCQPTYPVYVQQPVYVVQPQGHWETIQEQIWVPESSRMVQLDANTFRREVVPGHYVTVQRTIWVQDYR